MASPVFPEPPESVPPTPIDKVEMIVQDMVPQKTVWVHLSVGERIRLLEQCIENTRQVAKEWVEAVCDAKGLAQGDAITGEAWFSGPVTTIRNMRLLIDTLKHNGQPQAPGSWFRPNGQHVAQVFPYEVYDKILFSGITAEVWLKPGHPSTQGKIYREKLQGIFGEGGLSLVLGAGNITSIGPMDALHKLYVEDKIVILKTNPVNAYVGEIIERAFAPLVARKFFAVVHGGADVGQYLCRHKEISSIHVTGSDKTHDAIVWGPDDKKQQERKQKKKPVLDKPITSELGCVTPVFVVPGPWTQKELHYQAQHVVSMVTHNASFNCNAAKILVTASGWELRDSFLHLVQEYLADAPARKAYYPGAQDRFEGFLKAYPEARKLGKEYEHVVPWTFIPDVSPRKGEYALTNEAFCGVVAQMDIDATSADDFLEKATQFANEGIWGTLSCSMLIHPETEKRYPHAFDQAVSHLKYGGIGINVWPGLIYGLVVTTWGAYPCHSLDDVGSGIGVVHNSFLFDHPEKSVVRAPFQIKPKPVWFYNHRTLSHVAEAMMHFESAPSPIKLPKIIIPALAG